MQKAQLSTRDGEHESRIEVKTLIGGSDTHRGLLPCRQGRTHTHAALLLMEKC